MPSELGPFAIFRVEKVKTLGELRGRGEHNARTAKKGLEHTDPERPAGLIAGQDDAVAAWDERMAAAGLDPKKQRKDAVVALEWLATASPEWWPTASPETREEWKRDSLAHIVKEAGGAGNVLSAHFHEDESTAHIQALTIPLTKKARAATGRKRKGREDVERKPGPEVWALSARDLIGGSSARLVDLQTDYANVMAPHGLARGVSRKETGERNKAPAKWRAEQARLTDAFTTATDLARFNQRYAEEQRQEAQKDREQARQERQAAQEDARVIRGLAMEEARATLGAAGQEAARIVGAAKSEASRIVVEAKSQAARLLDGLRGYVEAVRGDAKRLAQAIHFPSYLERPEAAEARAAVEEADRKRAEEKAEAERRLTLRYGPRAVSTGRDQRQR